MKRVWFITEPNEKEGIQMQRRSRVCGLRKRVLNAWKISDWIYTKIGFLCVA